MFLSSNSNGVHYGQNLGWKFIIVWELSLLQDGQGYNFTTVAKHFPIHDSPLYYLYLFLKL
ncbi:hypothetical protein Hanom_Chr03g00216591 [Helianthus anomalus]